MGSRVLRRPEVEALTGKTRSGIYRDMTAGTFPRPIRLSPKAVGWLEEDVLAWKAARIAERDAGKVAA